LLSLLLLGCVTEDTVSSGDDEQVHIRCGKCDAAAVVDGLVDLAAQLGQGRHARFAFHSPNASACSAQRSLSGAGEKVHLVQTGLSHVPLFFVGTFQSQSRVAGRPHLQRRRRRSLHTIAAPPPGRLTRVQVMPRT
jgi:hypothetical protein